MHRTTHHAALAALLLTLAPLSGAAPTVDENDPIAPVWFGSNFDDTNGDKVIVGRLNTLHTVHESAGQVFHTMSVDGQNWEEPVLIGGYAGARQPTIATDTDGTLIVAAIQGVDDEGFGELSLAIRAWGDDDCDWFMHHLTTHAKEPDLVARGGRVYLTWSNGVEARFLEFPTASPPAWGVEGETVQEFPCDGVQVCKPSITLARHDCERFVYLGYMLEFDATEFPCSDCWQDFSWVSPFVHARGDDGVWSIVFSDPLNVPFPAEEAESIAFSINANYRTGDVFAAYSDTNDGTERTRIAHTDGTFPWDVAHLADEARKIHIAARERTSQPEFRIASVPRGAFQPEFLATGSAFRTGTWITGTDPDWTGAADGLVASGGVESVFHPQAVLWRRCAASVLTTVHSVGQFDDGPHYELRTHRESTVGCPPVAPGSTTLCPEDLMTPVFTTRTPAGLLVDTEPLGAPILGASRTATFRVVTPGGTESVTMRWDRGTARLLGDRELLLSDPDATIGFVAQGVRPTPVLLPRFAPFWNSAVRY